jgi:hypothetical protein
MSGDYDPIAPAQYAKEASERYPGSRLYMAKGKGHMVSMNGCGKDLASAFISSAGAVNEECAASGERHQFAGYDKIMVTGGAFDFANSHFVQSDLVDFVWLGLTLLLLILGSITVIFSVKKNRGSDKPVATWRIAKWAVLFLTLAILAMVTGLILSIQSTSQTNPYFLAIGVLRSYSWVFLLPVVILLLVIIIGFAVVSLWKGNKWPSTARYALTLSMLAGISYLVYLWHWNLY